MEKGRRIADLVVRSREIDEQIERIQKELEWLMEFRRYSQEEIIKLRNEENKSIDESYE